jgi:SulP family sulfate permease
MGRRTLCKIRRFPRTRPFSAFTGRFSSERRDKLAETTRDLTQFGEVVILRLRNRTALDATGIRAPEKLSDRLHKTGKTLLFCGA